MKNYEASNVWFVLGTFGLLGLWLSLALAPETASIAGFVFLGSPILAALFSFAPMLRHDRVSALCVAGLGVLFCVAWFV